MTIHRRVARCAGAALLACVLASGAVARADAAPAQGGYTITEAGDLGTPVGVNAAGEVASFEYAFGTHPYLIPPPYSSYLTLDGPRQAFAVLLQRISDHGDAVGYYQVTNDTQSDFVDVGLTWTTSGQATEVNGYRGVPKDHYNVDLEDTNDRGQLIGTAYRPGYGYVATIWSPAHVAAPLYPADQTATASAINNLGVVGGSIGGHAALFLRGGGVRRLGRAPGESASTVLDLNDSNEAIGTSTFPDGRVAPVYWDAAGHVHGIVRPPGRPMITVTGLNNSGEFVGTALSNSHNSVPVLWDSPSNPVLLPLGNGTYSYGGASSINDAGVVAGTGVVANEPSGGYRTVLVWTPAS